MFGTNAAKLVLALSTAGFLIAQADSAAARPPTSTIWLDTENTDNGKKGTRGHLVEPSSDEARARALLTHSRNERRLQSAGALGNAQSADVDVDGDGVQDIAVIVDNGKIILPAVPANALDLPAGLRIRYTPVGADTFDLSLALGQSLDPTFGPDLGLGDDAFAQVPFAAGFPFLGQTHGEVFVGSDGHVTFGAGDGSSNTRDAARHIGGPPRLSVLLTDLDPTCGAGSVHADARGDRVVVTWSEVVHFERESADGCNGVPTNTMQATLFSDGTIDFIFGALDTGLISQTGSNREAVTGIAEGNSEGPLNPIDMTEDPPLQLQAGAIFEQFSAGSPETFDSVQIAQEFYRTHADKYDYLVVFTDFEIFGGGTAFHLGVKNQTKGLGSALSDFSSIFGSAGELESFVWMNNINLWVGNTAEDYTEPHVHNFRVTTTPRLTALLGGNITPTDAPYDLVGMVDITGRGLSNGYSHHGRALTHENPNTEARASRGALRYDVNSPISIMFQEADHRWSAFSAFVHPTKGVVVPDSFDLLGRDLAHWSTFFNTTVIGSPFAQADGQPRFSGMEGNAILELEIDADGNIVDKNDPNIVIADPDGKLAAAHAACATQGKGLFLTDPDELTDGATELDQYLMGVRIAGDVSPFWYVDEPSSAIDGRSLDEPFPADFIRGSTFNVDDIAFCGIRVDLTVENITDLRTSSGARGPRVPAIGDENDVGPVGNCLAENLGSGPCVDVKTMAWILVVRSGPPPSTGPAIRRLNHFRQAWQAYVDGPGLGGRNADGVERQPTDPGFISKFDTSLEPAIH